MVHIKKIKTYSHNYLSQLWAGTVKTLQNPFHRLTPPPPVKNSCFTIPLSALLNLCTILKKLSRDDFTLFYLWKRLEREKCATTRVFFSFQSGTFSIQVLIVSLPFSPLAFPLRPSWVYPCVPSYISPWVLCEFSCCLPVNSLISSPLSFLVSSPLSSLMSLFVKSLITSFVVYLGCSLIPSWFA